MKTDLVNAVEECLRLYEDTQRRIEDGRLSIWTIKNLWANLASRLIMPMLELNTEGELMNDIRLELDSLFNKIVDDRNVIIDEQPNENEIIGMLTSYIKRLRIILTKAEVLTYD